jgi:hypothetical protein
MKLFSNFEILSNNLLLLNSFAFNRNCVKYIKKNITLGGCHGNTFNWIKNWNGWNNS